ncbi:MAG: hypothetical protein HXX18_09510 [Bacteroidetes bacterium]|nr:hypothetical protein [Bacteroidota bacterium]
MNLLENLIKYEAEIKNHNANIDDGFELNFSHNLKMPVSNREIFQIDVEIIIGDYSFYTKMNKVFIHQIGKRIYDEEYGNEYLPLFHQWVEDFNNDTESFKKRIKQVFKNNSLIIKYFETNKKMIYGIVSDKFEVTNQLDFRKRFIEVAQERGVIDIESPTMYQVTSSKYSQIKEYFKFETDNSQVQLSCGIVYGLNNGYGAYTVHWIREYKESKTWFSPIKSSKQDYKWRNNPKFHDESSKVEMIKFVDFIIDQGITHSKFIEEKVKIAQENPINVLDMNTFLKLLKVAEATKVRIKDQFSEEVLKKGNTEFSFSESIRNIGTFDKYTGKATKRLLIETGTRIIEEDGIKALISEDLEFSIKGDYDWY